MDKETLLERLRATIARHFGKDHRLGQAEPLTGGAASSTWRFSVENKQAQQILILRLAQGAPQISTGLNKRIEADVQRAAIAGGVPAANILFVLQPEDGLGDGFVMEYLQGETIPQKLLRDDRYAQARQHMTRQCGEIAARIHAIDPTRLQDLPLFSAEEQLAEYERIYREFGESIPTFELALRWLERRLPRTTEWRLVHGDFRNGNFLVTPEDGITAILDWELAHRGDALEDLGWLCVNSWRFGNRDRPVGGFGGRQELYDAYQAASGRSVDTAHVHYWEIFGTLRWGIMCLHLSFGHLQGSERSVERAAIGRRVSETEIDLLTLLEQSDGD